MQHTRIILVTILSALPALTVAQAPATQPSATTAPVDADFEAQLAAIDARALAHKDLTADFVQEKHSPLLRKPIISRGTVLAKGASALWVTTEPEPSRMSVDPQWLRLHYPKQKIIEEYPIGGQLGMLAASPLPALAAIRKNFTLTPDTGEGLNPAEPVANETKALRLEPVEALRGTVGHVRVLLDVSRGLVLAFEVTDPDGERTLVRFSNLRTDTGLPDNALTLSAPAGTKVVRPVGDQMPATPTTR
jgi:hypothetical protein